MSILRGRWVLSSEIRRRYCAGNAGTIAPLLRTLPTAKDTWSTSDEV